MATATEEKIVPTEEQNNAIRQLVSVPKHIQIMGGVAGVGKSYVISQLAQRMRGWAVCAYTGKAAQVLRRKGIQASTIHSLIYHYVKDEYGNGEFQLRHPDLFEHNGIIVDEASMVAEDIYRDLKSFGVPLIFVGDHGQLEPVGSKGFNLMKNPDITLTEIHRYAGEIAYFAQHLRNGKDASEWETKDQVEIVPVDRLSELDVSEDDQLICAFNKTRVALNTTIRQHLGKDELPEVGDRIICLQNDRELGVFNGMQGKIAKIDHCRTQLVFDDGQRQYTCNYNPIAFNSDTTPQREEGLIPFDYAYCCTAHKCQGDEFDRVIVVEQRCRHWAHERWAYTSASRAKQKLTWVLDR